MSSAAIGLLGVLVGAFLTQLFATSREWRAQRLEAMVEVASATGRVIGAHERIYELFEGNAVPPITGTQTMAAMRERSDAHLDWRKARSRLEILIAEDVQLLQSIREFEKYRRTATTWIQAYQRDPSKFRMVDYAEIQSETWQGMRAARYEIMEAARQRLRKDARLDGRIRSRFATLRPEVVKQSREA